MICGLDLNNLVDSGKFPCAICRSCVGSNSIFCADCNLWVHKKCSGLRGRLFADPNYRCKRCSGEARPIGRGPIKSVAIGDFNQDVVNSSRYLGDVLGVGGGCFARSSAAWGKFRELIPILSCRSCVAKFLQHV